MTPKTDGGQGTRPGSRSWPLGALIGCLGVVLGVLFATVGPAMAHVGVTSTTSEAGASATVVISVPHGCAGEATTEVVVSIPEGINSVTPTRHAFWEVSKQVEPVDSPEVDSHGVQYTERVASVTYRADDPLPEGYRDAFELSVRLPEDAGTLPFPTIQVCGEQETAWTEVPEEGQDPEQLQYPAPSLAVVASSGSGHGGSAAEEPSSDQAAQETATSGPDAWNVLALALGVLGAVLGGLALVRSRRPQG